MTALGERVHAARARELILSGKAPAGLVVTERLDLSRCKELRELPPGLKVASLNVSGCTRLTRLPEGLQVRHLNASGCTALAELPPGLRCYHLDLQGTAVRELPADLQVEFKLDLSDCTELRSLPENLKVGSLVLRGCTALAALPRGLDVCFLDLQGCSSLADWPEDARVRIGRLNARGCTRLSCLPRGLQQLSQLDVSDCPNLRELPEDLRVTSWLDLAHTGITRLPQSLAGVALRWRGAPIDERIAFHPETITAAEVLTEPNAERRRALLDRMGYERFLDEAEAEVLDVDGDPGGERRLLRVRLERDEDLVCVAVSCPSTGRRYILRVPPTMQTCLQAVAWTAGYDNPDEYRPMLET